MSRKEPALRMFHAVSRYFQDRTGIKATRGTSRYDASVQNVQKQIQAS